MPLDIVFNGKVAGRNMVPFYSLVYRARAGFRAERLLPDAHLAPPPARFWSGFFIGAVPTAAPAPRYITGPMIHGANSSSPTPLSSLFDRLPDATATISSKI